MLPYYVLVGVPAAMAFFNTYLQSERIQKRIIHVFFLFWMALVMCRDLSVGVDTVNYMTKFEAVRWLSFGDIFGRLFSQEYEIGFFLLAKFISLFTEDFRVVIVAVALLSIIPIWILYKNYATNHPLLAISIFLSFGLFSMYFSGMRQILAMSFVPLAFHCVKEKKLLPFILLVLAAFLFHNSALILFLLYPVYHIRLDWKYSIPIVAVVLLVVYRFRVPIFRFLSIFFNEYYSFDVAATGAGAIAILLILFTVFSYVVYDNASLTPEINGLRNILVLCAVLQLFAGINSIAMRMNYYYLLLVPLLIPQIIVGASHKNRNLAALALWVMVPFFLGYFFYNAYTSTDYLNIYPYIPLWAS